MLRIALAATDGTGLAATVEGEKKALLPVQAGGHVNFIRINGKVNHSPLHELKEGSSRIALIFILRYGMFRVLPCCRIFQLQGAERNPVQGEHHVNRTRIRGVAGHLAGNMEAVFLKQRYRLLHQSMRRFEAGEPEVLAVKLEAMPDDVHGSLALPLLHQRLNQLFGKLTPVQFFHLLP